LLKTPEFYGSSPSVFVGHSGYPQVNVGIMSPSLRNPDAWLHDAPSFWSSSDFKVLGASVYTDKLDKPIYLTNFDKFLNEGIGSCSVTATIELITEEDGKIIVLNTSNDVKLQLVRSSAINYQGQEVLYTSMKTCSSSKSCGASECCFNNRCWDQSLVSQCLDETLSSGNRGVGENCESDFQCASLCCNRGTGACAVHTNIGSEPVLCGKSPGEQCVAKEWCRKENLSDCYIVRTGTSPTGVVECALRCYNIPTHGTCRGGFCLSPQPNAVPTFDPTNPNCTSARDPLTTVPN